MVACGKPAPVHHDDARHVAVAVVAADAGGPVPQPGTGDDLASVLRQIIPADARVIGFGELHQRTDRTQVTSTLSHFTTEALPALADKLSDLVVETWIVDPNCGKAATEATAKVEMTMRRPQETKSEIGTLADAARKAGIQPHAMHLTCDDYTHVAPPGKEVDPVAMLSLTTRELGRIATEAVIHRDGEATHRPWIAVYGGALHNDRFPDAGVAEWSYAAKLDGATQNHFVEVDLIVPELAEADPQLAKQPWFALAKSAGAKPQVWKRGERSFVVILPRTPKSP